MEWTTEQRKAIDTRGAELLVSAGAGSGKTAVLTARILALLEEGADLEHMLIMTFTRAAAGEMRQRIGKALSEAAEHNSHLQAQWEKLSGAPIYTIDAFCAQLVREYFYLVDVDPAFRILDEDGAKALQREVMQDLLEESYAKEDKAFEALSQTYTSGWRDDAFEDMLLACYRQIQNQQDPLGWLHRQVEAFHIDEKDFETCGFVTTALQDGVMTLQGAKERLAYGLYLSEQPNGPYTYTPLFEKEMGLCDTLISACKQGLKAFAAALEAVCTMPTFNKVRAPKDGDESLRKWAQEARNHAKEMLQELYDRWAGESNHLERLQKVYPILKTLEEVQRAFHQKLLSRKGEKGAYEFGDIAQLALTVLQFPEVTKELQEKTDYLFIDEYQDTSDLQEALLKGCGRGNNLFMVGDLKQSIYGFRAARPDLFLKKYLTFGDEGHHRRMDLNLNFRSRPAILKAVNDIFSRLMSPELGGFVYDGKAALQAGRTEDPGEAVEVYFYLKDEDKEGQEVSESTDEQEEEGTEAQKVADRIKALIGQPIKDGEKVRPIRYKDIAVLLRSAKNTLQQWQEVFADNGIPLFAEGQKSRLNDPEVAVLLSLLRVMDNFQQDIPLLSILRSGLFSFTENDLLALRNESRDTEFFYQAFEACAKGETPLSLRCEQVLQTLKRYETLSKHMGVDQLLYRILEETGFEEWVGACPGGQGKLLNLQMFLAQAAQFAAGGQGGIYGFLQYFDALSLKDEKELSMPPLSGEEEDVVRLMTIHKSKGLEFPIVIVAQLGKTINRHQQPYLKIHPLRGFGPSAVDLENRCVYTTLAEENVDFAYRKENIEEEIRILYVALTRAKEKLILTGTLKQKELLALAQPLSPHFLLSAPNALTWVGSILLRHPDGEPLRERLQRPVPLLENNSAFKVTVEPLGTVAPLREELEEGFAGYLQNPLKPGEEVIKALSFVYPYEADTRLPTKVAPHELYGEAAQTPELPDKVPLFLAKEGLSAMDKGTLMHRFCRWVDPMQATDEAGIKKQIDLALEKGILPPEARDVLTLKALSPLLTGPLFDRMRKSDLCLKEQPFTYSLPACELFSETQSTDPILVQGIMDCCFMEDGQWVIVDYKTDKVFLTPLQTALRHQGQLGLYQKALEAMTGQKVKEKIIYLFEVSQGVIIP